MGARPINANQKSQVLKDLRQLALKGPLKPSKSGSNAVGKLLQAELNIKHKVTTKNFYKGFVLTATGSNSAASRTNLFAAVADWENSPIKSSTELVDRFGKENASKGYEKSLFCTVNAKNSNSFGLRLKSNAKNLNLIETYTNKQGITENILTWNTKNVITKLSRLANTAIVTAIPSVINGDRYFHFRYVEFMGNPDPQIFFELIEDGTITLDHLISRQYEKKAAREQGPLFKMSNAARPVLFPEYSKYDLMVGASLKD